MRDETPPKKRGYQVPKFRPLATGKCPNCTTHVRFEGVSAKFAGGPWQQMIAQLEIEAPSQGVNPIEAITLSTAACPDCGALILTVEARESGFGASELGVEYVTWPLRAARPVPPEVPEHVRGDYSEAALVLNLSPKASAALSRRCLQAVLREAGGANQHDLSKQIDAVFPILPTYIGESVDAIRNIGNFAAHPLKDTASNQILDVEPGEAEWNLEVLEMLFDFYYVQPAQTQKKKAALDAKLASAGKPPMKSPPP